MKNRSLFSVFKLLLTASVLVLWLSGCASQVQTSSSESGTSLNTPFDVTIKDTSFSSTGGSIDIRDINVTIEEAAIGDPTEDVLEPRDRVPSPSRITATVVNNTESTFETILFDVYLRSSEGRTIATQTVAVTDRVSPGSVARFDYSLAGEMRGDVEYDEDMTFEIDLDSAIYVAQYDFDLKDGKNLTFENDSLSVKFNPTREGIGFELQNKTDTSMQIKWDRVSYVDIEGSSHSVIKSGTRYSERNEPRNPTSVAPNSFVEDVIFPADYIEYSSYFNEYRKEDLFPNGEESQRYEGESFSIYMPLSIGGSDVNLDLEFYISDVSY